MIRIMTSALGGAGCVAVSLCVLLCTSLAVSPSMAAPQPAATIHFVAPDGDCGAYTPCYASIQAAVDAAGSGDDIRVAQGLYTGVSARAGITQMVYLNKTLAISGGYSTSDWDTSHPAAQPTVLDAEFSGRIFYLTGGISPTIANLTMVRGNAEGLGGSGFGAKDSGGAVYVNQTRGTLHNSVFISNTAHFSPTFSDSSNGGAVSVLKGEVALSGNTFVNNTAQNGGAVHSDNSTVTISGGAIISNSATWGGGIYVSAGAAILSGNTFISNTGSFGGAVEARSSLLTVHGNTFRDNDASFGGALLADGIKSLTITNNIMTHNSASFGGALNVDVNNPGTALIRGNLMSDNEAAWGGGMHASCDSLTFDGNLVLGNRAHYGVGIWLSDSNGRLANNVIADNQAITYGRGIGVSMEQSSIDFVHTTIARNSGGDGSGVCLEGRTASVVTMTNTIVADQPMGITVTAGSSVTLDSILWARNWNNTGGAGSLSASNVHDGDPGFKSDGYHLARSSAAIDRGIASAATVDLDGDPRPYGPAADLGADEFTPWTAKRWVHIPVIIR